MPQSPWMSPAWTELGQRESLGASTNPRIAQYFRRVGHAHITDDETAWCAAFVGACLEAAGITSTRSLRARSYLDWGVAIDAPPLGAITILARGDDPALGHVGFLVGETETHVILLGGNQSDAVTVARFDRRDVLGFRLPAAANIPNGQPRDDDDSSPRATDHTSVTTPTSETEAPSFGAGRTHEESNTPAFTRALALILDFEGGWSDDPFDPGGPTNRGITLSTLARERGLHVTAETVSDLKSQLRRITDDEVSRIFRERYWRPARCSDMPEPLALIHFDASVNQGVIGAARMLQDALDVTIDGEMGPITLAAANSCDLTHTITRYADIRRAHYRSLSHFWRFGRGWLRRVDTATTAALVLATRRSLPSRSASATTASTRSGSTPPASRPSNSAPTSRTTSTRPGPASMQDQSPRMSSRSPAQQYESGEPISQAPFSTSPEASPPPSPTRSQSPPVASSSNTTSPAAGKWWGESLTIWGALLTAVTTVAPAIFSAFGIDISADLLRALSRDVTNTVQAIGGLVGTFMTIAGRIRASAPIERRTLQIRL